MANIQQNKPRRRSFLMVSSRDHISPGKGLKVHVDLSKDGELFRAAEGKVSEVGRGWYRVDLTENDTNTIGDLSFECNAQGADPTSFQDQVVR